MREGRRVTPAALQFNEWNMTNLPNRPRALELLAHERNLFEDDIRFLTDLAMRSDPPPPSALRRLGRIGREIDRRHALPAPRRKRRAEW